MKLKILSFCFFILHNLFSQDILPCGKNIMSNLAISNEPNLKKNLDSLKNQQNSILDKISFKNNYIIPTVIHIIHDGGSSNISNDQIYDAIRIINEDFNKLNDDTIYVNEEFTNIIGDIGVEFKLAQIDEFGNCTKGITRTFSSLTNNAYENVKNLVKWDPSKYLNIWVAQSLAIDAGGYSYFPGSAPNNDANAGIVILASQFGSIGQSYSSNSAARSLTHEIGHYLNLEHTWGSGEQGENSNCFDDDGINDTPNTIGSQSCNLNQISCNSIDNVQNYMDYSTCGYMFTQGQKNRMILALESGNPWQNAPRNNLHTEENLIATGVHTSTEYSECIAIIDFRPEKRISCVGDSVKWENYSYNFDSLLSYEWFFEGGSPNYSNEKNPNIAYFESGEYYVSLTITTPAGSASRTISNSVIIQNNSAILSPNIIDFNSNNFPYSSSNQWLSENNFSNSTWHWNQYGSNSSIGSIRIRSFNFENDDPKKIYSPKFNLENLTSPSYLYYDYAYAKKSDESNDILKIKVSNDCGLNWITRLSKNTDNLTTVNNNYFFSFIPTNNNWEEEKISLTPWIGDSLVQFLFEFSGNEGNYLYIDNVRIGNIDLSVNEFDYSEQKFRVFPNPVNKNSIIQFELNYDSIIQFELFNLIGNSFGKYKNLFQKGNHALKFFDYFSPLSPSIYFLKLNSSNNIHTIKVILN
ncbi:MAG: hypothetical protein CMD07_02060 [Flavobacteriales bacterium]|nr:hypothetical protein [Flavobacteriales bacterium]|tara:strand:+ start:73 stop:2154 length:2082 start_codon:yes stop_codon:yes gene_type:complete